MKKKSQLAIEFLLTYGWAIVTVIAAVAALWYLGIIDPGNVSQGSRCTVGPGFTCVDAKATSSGIRFSLMNNLGEDIEALYVDFRGDVDGCQMSLSDYTYQGRVNFGYCTTTVCSYKYDDFYASQYAGPIKNGNIITGFHFNSAVGPCSDPNFVEIDYIITYRKVGEKINHTVVGEFKADPEK